VDKSSTVVVAPQAVADKIEARKVDHVLANGQSVTIGALKITAVPMYNNTRGPEAGKLYHDNGRGNGYLITVGGKTLYVAGDTACTTDMKALTGVDHALLPMNLPYTMTPAEAAACVQAFKPAVVTPYHYANSDLTEFTTVLNAETGVTVVLAEFYLGGTPW
jgi:L-ascorbate metabolism protein UlaG (beta-lactamase superfamily)